MSRKKRMAFDTCVYCGVNPGATDDHVIPRSYFRVVPQNVITVPCCRACNERKGVVEQLYRLLGSSARLSAMSRGGVV